MSKNHHGGPGPVPPGNRAGKFPAKPDDTDAPAAADEAGSAGAEAGAQPQDPERRLGGFTGTGEHSRQQPGPLNDGGRVK